MKLIDLGVLISFLNFFLFEGGRWKLISFAVNKTVATGTSIMTPSVVAVSSQGQFITPFVPLNLLVSVYCVCVYLTKIHIYRLAAIAIQTGGIQLLEMAKLQNSLCGERGRVSNSFDSWICFFFFSLEVIL